MTATKERFHRKVTQAEKNAVSFMIDRQIGDICADNSLLELELLALELTQKQDGTIGKRLALLGCHVAIKAKADRPREFGKRAPGEPRLSAAEERGLEEQ